jgi:large subunit ribosomal protein L19
MKAAKLTKETILNYGIIDRNFPHFKVGDTIEVAQIIKEGDKERIQLYEGDVIALHNNGVASTFTVRRIGANGIGVEKIFPYYAKTIDSIRLVKHGSVRRAKLTYLRKRLGKSARIKENVLFKEEEQKVENQAPEQTPEKQPQENA